MTTALDRAPMALTEDFEVYRDTALEWMAAQTEPFTSATTVPPALTFSAPPACLPPPSNSSAARPLSTWSSPAWQPSTA